MADVNMKIVRDYALEKGLTPTGRKVGVTKVANTALYRLAYVDDKPGKLPEPYTGLYTKTNLAKVDLDKYILNCWKDADEAEAKKAKKEQENAVATQRMIEALEPKTKGEDKSGATET